MKRLSILTIALAIGAITIARAADTLDIYFIDVEGGQSTLFVTPSGESLLVDTGYAGNNGRDVSRIMAAVRDAGLKQIDYLLITHFHPDHDGGIVELASRIPIRTFIDHGDFGDGLKVATPAAVDAYKAYLPIRAKGKHLRPVLGARLPLKDAQVTFVSTAGRTIDHAVEGAATPTAGCPTSAAPEPNFENPRSTGFHLRFGDFRVIDVGDLSGGPLYSLLCPANKLGRIDAYLVPHHGGDDVSEPAYIRALGPRVAIMNNGATKGGGAKTFAMLHDAKLEGVWQIDRSGNGGVVNFADDRIANLDDTTGHALKLSANRDGSFQITNQRSGRTVVYAKKTR